MVNYMDSYVSTVHCTKLDGRGSIKGTRLSDEIYRLLYIILGKEDRW